MSQHRDSVSSVHIKGFLFYFIDTINMVLSVI